MMKLVVLSCLLAAASAISPSLYGGYVSPLAYSAPLLQPYNYRGPLSLAPGQPANILAADGRPLDTLDVNLDRSAHLVARALENGPRVLSKRSVTRLAVAPGPVGFSAAVASGNVGISAPVAVNPVGVAAAIATNPAGLSTPFAAGIASPFAAGSIGLTAPLAAGLGVSAPLTAGPIAVSAPIAAGFTGIPAFGSPLVRNF